MCLASVAVILVGTWGRLRESVNIALDAVPKGIDITAAYLSGLPVVVPGHDRHVWDMSMTESALTAHLVMPNGTMDDSQLARICQRLHDTFGIEHATLQVEGGDPAHPWPLASTCNG